MDRALGLFAGALALALVALGLGAWGPVDPGIRQALIAGGVVALGWWVNGAAARAEARRLRAERLRDMHKALFAEIRDVCAAYWLEGRADDHAARIVARMEADPAFVPFIPREAHGLIFREMIPQIDVLPRQTIDWIVSFYAVVRSIEALADDMRGARFPTLEQARRIAVYRDYIGMRRRAFDLGQTALKLVALYAEPGGPAKVDRLAARISSPEPDRSGPASRGSG